MALAIGYDIRPQQSMKVKTKQQVLVDNMARDFGIKETVKQDYGSEIVVI